MTNGYVALRSYRQTRNLSCAEFAEQLGIAEPTLRSLENGTRAITPERAKEIEEKTAGELTRETLRPDIFDAVGDALRGATEDKSRVVIP